MAITVKYLEDLGIEKSIAEKIFAERGAEIEKDKAKLTAVEAELKANKEAFDTLNSEFETLKSTNADGEKWKSQFEALQAQIDKDKKQAEADRILREKNESIEKRFNAVVGDKEFNHEAIRADYLKKFTEALENKDFLCSPTVAQLHPNKMSPITPTLLHLSHASALPQSLPLEAPAGCALR